RTISPVCPHPTLPRKRGWEPAHRFAPSSACGGGLGWGPRSIADPDPRTRCSSIATIVARPHRRRSRTVMSTRAMGPATGWSWLARAVNLGRANPRAVIGAIALVALVAVLPSIVQMVLQPAMGAQPNALLTVAALTTLASLIVFPLLIGGVLRVIDATEHGRPAVATGVFDAFRGGSGAGRLIGFGLLMTALYLLVFGTIIGSFGQGLPEWYMQLMQLTMEAGGKPVQ